MDRMATWLRPEPHRLPDRVVVDRGEPYRLVCHGVEAAQPGPTGVIGLGLPSGGSAQLTTGARERRQPATVRCRAVPSEQLVQADTRSEVFQHEKTSSHVGGDDARSEPWTHVAEKLESRQFRVQSPMSGAGPT